MPTHLDRDCEVYEGVEVEGRRELEKGVVESRDEGRLREE